MDVKVLRQLINSHRGHNTPRVSESKLSVGLDSALLRYCHHQRCLRAVRKSLCALIM